MFTLATEKNYKDGEIILQEGNSGDWVYVVLGGSVEITKTIRDKTYKLGILEEEDIFGELSFLGGIERTTTARAIGETTVGIIDRGPLDIEFNRLSKDFRALIRNTAKRYKYFTDTLSNMALKNEMPALRSLSLNYKDRSSFLRAYQANNGTQSLCIRTANPLKKEEKILIKLSLPGISNPLKIIGKVIWTRKQSKDSGKQPPGMGIRLCEMSKKDSHSFQLFLKGVLEN